VPPMMCNRRPGRESGGGGGGGENERAVSERQSSYAARVGNFRSWA
jgi:hypothetical protein